MSNTYIDGPASSWFCCVFGRQGATVVPLAGVRSIRAEPPIDRADEVTIARPIYFRFCCAFVACDRPF
jgi:hypothetical protein